MSNGITTDEVMQVWGRKFLRVDPGVVVSFRDEPYFVEDGCPTCGGTEVYTLSVSAHTGKRYVSFEYTRGITNLLAELEEVRARMEGENE